jgi:pilus assembly protein CpaC
MKIDRFLQAALVGFTLAAAGAAPAVAETLSIQTGTASSPLHVPMNRAVVVESDTPFAELSIANPGIADISTLSDRSIYVLGKAPGRTTLTLLGPDGKLITNVDVQVTPDVAEFKERLQQILPGEAIEVRTANDGIVLSGIVSSIAKLDRALDLAERYAPARVSNLLQVGGEQQVMLKVRFAEMARSVSKGLNAEIEGVGAGGSYFIGSGNASGFGGVSGAFNIGNLALGVALAALEDKGLVRTLAEPNLTTLSGQEATFFAGGEFPVPTEEDDENGGITIEFKPFGIELKFTPRVVDKDMINIEMNAAVSQLDAKNSREGIGGLLIPAFSRRETTTTVELRDGESFAIAGLLQDEFTDRVEQVPWLGDVPVLGALFRSSQYQRNQTELVIIVTPHLVSPIRGDYYALPTDRVRPPAESELFLFGTTAAAASEGGAGAAEVARQDFRGSYGYVME